MRRDIRKFCVPELYRGDVIQKDVVQEADKQVQMVLEQALERPVAGQVRSGQGIPAWLGVVRPTRLLPDSCRWVNNTNNLKR